LALSVEYLGSSASMCRDGAVCMQCVELRRPLATIQHLHQNPALFLSVLSYGIIASDAAAAAAAAGVVLTSAYTACTSALVYCACALEAGML
jgi:hypothetical protein